MDLQVYVPRVYFPRGAGSYLGRIRSITCQDCDLHRREGSEYIRGNETLIVFGSYAILYLKESRM